MFCVPIELNSCSGVLQIEENVETCLKYNVPISLIIAMLVYFRTHL